ncbi:hypothetical protein D3C72_2156540 [compost metagenome]
MPPAMADSHSPLRMEAAARCSVTSEEEQAVSTAMLGPLKLNSWEVRAGIILTILSTRRFGWVPVAPSFCFHSSIIRSCCTLVSVEKLSKLCRFIRFKVFR